MSMATSKAASAPQRPPITPPRRAVAGELRSRYSPATIASESESPTPAAAQRCNPNGARLTVIAQKAAIRKIRKSQAFQNREAALDFGMEARFSGRLSVGEDSGSSGRVRLMRPFSAGLVSYKPRKIVGAPPGFRRATRPCGRNMMRRAPRMDIRESDSDVNTGTSVRELYRGTKFQAR